MMPRAANTMANTTLKLISLNAWGGILFDQLADFLRKKRDETDIFCFQEVLFGERPVFTEQGLRENLFNEFKSILADFRAFERPAPAGGKFKGKILKAPFGLAMFVKNTIQVEDDGGFLTYSEDSAFAKSDTRTPTGNFQYARVAAGGEKYSVGNIHGLWISGTKGDTSERIEQSEKIVNFFARENGKGILCGDFNLRPETESIAMISREMRNLIGEYRVESTRNELYNSMDEFKDFTADYIFVSPGARVRDFKVLGDVVSDHLPLYAEFS